jgi:hypothetical protein
MLASRSSKASQQSLSAAGSAQAKRNRRQRPRRRRGIVPQQAIQRAARALSQPRMGQGRNGPVQGAAVAYSTRTQSRLPRIISQGPRGFRVQHRELVVASVNNSNTFSVQSTLLLNPGLAATFPWLAPQAGQWEQYVVHKLDAEWIPIAPTSTQGDVIISPDYDSSDPAPTTETQASDNVDTVVDSVWKNILVKLDPKAMMGMGPRKYVRPCAVAGDIKTFDVGKLFICTNNSTGGATAVGKLWLDYDFEFFVPQNSPNPDTTPQQTSMFIRSTNQTFTTATPAPLQFATVSYDPLSFGPAVAGVFTPPAGVYRLSSQATCNDSANEAFTVRMDIYKNGALVTGLSSEISQPAFAGDNLSLTIDGIVPLNGTDTVNIEMTMTGAAGTLIVTGAFAQLVVSLA